MHIAMATLDEKNQRIRTLVDYEQYIVKGGKVTYSGWLKIHYPDDVESWDVANKVSFPPIIQTWVRSNRTKTPMKDLMRRDSSEYGADQDKLRECVREATIIDKEIMANKIEAEVRNSNPVIQEIQRYEEEVKSIPKHEDCPSYTKWDELTPDGWNVVMRAFTQRAKEETPIYSYTPTADDVVSGDYNRYLGYLYDLGLATSSNDWYLSPEEAKRTLNVEDDKMRIDAARSFASLFPQDKSESIRTSPIELVERFNESSPELRHNLMLAGSRESSSLGHYFSKLSAAKHSGDKEKQIVKKWDKKDITNALNQYNYDREAGTHYRPPDQLVHFIEDILKVCPRTIKPTDTGTDLPESSIILMTAIEILEYEEFTNIDVYRVLKASMNKKKRDDFHNELRSFYYTHGAGHQNDDAKMWSLIAPNINTFSEIMGRYCIWKEKTSLNPSGMVMPADIESVRKAAILLCYMPYLIPAMKQLKHEFRVDKIPEDRETIIKINDIYSSAVFQNQKPNCGPSLKSIDQVMKNKDPKVILMIWHYCIRQWTYLAHLNSLLIFNNVDQKRLENFMNE